MLGKPFYVPLTPANPSNPALGAVLGFIGIFSPGIGLKLALLPVYNKWRRHKPARSALRGLNAAASGLVYTAVWQLFLGESTPNNADHSRLHLQVCQRERVRLGSTHV